MKRNILITILVTFIIIISYIIFSLLIPFSFDKQIIVVQINKGATYDEVLEILDDKGLIRNKAVFRILGVLSGADKKLKAGNYEFSSGTTPIRILSRLISGESNNYIIITIVPGVTVWTIAKIFESQKIMTKKEFIDLAFDKKFLNSLNIKAPSIEGYIFPDTYKFNIYSSSKDLIKIMVINLRKNYPKNFQQRIAKLKMSENQILTLASLIEREAKYNRERPLISAVYHNRLKKGIKLQADPTTIYGIKSYKEGVTKQDLKQDTPYNTYKIKGLPPGPISTPSIKSIIASLNPSRVKYLYFVSKRNGRHYFSTTYAQHKRAIKKYLKGRRSIKKSKKRAT